MIITRGGEYTAEALPVSVNVFQSETSETITLLVDGQAVAVETMLWEGNYYFSAEGLNAILGTNAVTAEGVMTLSAKANAATGAAG